MAVPPKYLFADTEDLFEIQPSVPTGVKPIDDFLGGLPNQELIVVAGQASQGKTSLATQFAYNIAQSGEPTGFFSMEMSKRALAQRIACSVIGLDSRRLKHGAENPLTEKEKAQFHAIRETMIDLPLVVDERPGLTSELVAEEMEVMVKRYKIRAAFLDYVGLMEGDSDNRQEVVGSSIRALKGMAKEFDIPVVALVQFNRGINYRADKTPLFSDLRDSGQIEQHSDIILMFSYPNDPADKDDVIRECQIHVRKNRNGETGVIHTQFNRKFTRFEQLDTMALMGESEKREARTGGVTPAKPKGAWERDDKQ